nr:NADH dehydrogenase subunit 6 [Amanita sp. CQC-2022a]WIF29659.1 NADH dehydrogenase subunit 6 [Amanita sp. CQC-2022a]
MTILTINLLALVTVLCAVFSITSKNPVVSVIFLISTFVLAAGYLILIGINFIGISYIVIYVGAIAILFLFIIMMINIKLSDILETGPQYSKNLPLAIAIGSIFIYIVFTILPFNFNNVPALSLLLDNITNINSILLNIISVINIFTFGFELIGVSVNWIYLTLHSDIIISDFQQIEILGHGLYTYDAVLLIILSIILLLGMFTAIILSKSNSNINSKSNSKDKNY